MSDVTLRRTIWAARLNANFQKELVYANLATREFEGDAQFGRTVLVNTLGSVTVANFAGSGSVTWNQVSATSQSIQITNQKVFAQEIPHILQKQTNVNLVDGYMTEIAYALADAADQSMVASYTDISGSMNLGVKTIGLTTQVSISGSGVPVATPGLIASSSAYDLIVDLGRKLSENNVPKANRFVVIPAWFTALMAKDPRWTVHYEVLQNGFVQGGKINGIQVYETNNVPNTAGVSYIIISGVPSAWAFAGQLQSMEIVTNHPDKFSDGIKGLYVYGCKVMKNTGLAYATCTAY